MLGVVRFLNRWAPAVAWMLIMFWGSGDVLSSEHTSRFLVPFLHWIAPGLSSATVASIQLAVRKCAHVVEYSVLAILFWRAVSGWQWSRRSAAVMAFAFTVAYAGIDEFHQTFIPSRTGMPQDVAIDSFGAFLGAWLCFRFGKSGRQSTRRPEIQNTR